MHYFSLPDRSLPATSPDFLISTLHSCSVIEQNYAKLLTLRRLLPVQWQPGQEVSGEKHSFLISSLIVLLSKQHDFSVQRSVAQMTPVCSGTGLEQHNTGLFAEADLKVQEELPSQPSFMKLHAFPGRIQGQSLRASASQQPFSKGCLVLACAMGQRVAASCPLLAPSPLGCHQFVLSDASRTVPLSLPPSHSLQHTLSPQGLKPAHQSCQENGCCAWDTSGKQAPHSCLTAITHGEPQAKGHHLWGTSGKYLPRVNGHHTSSSARKLPPQGNGRLRQMAAAWTPSFAYMPCSAEGCRTRWNQPAQKTEVFLSHLSHPQSRLGVLCWSSCTQGAVGGCSLPYHRAAMVTRPAPGLLLLPLLHRHAVLKWLAWPLHSWFVVWALFGAKGWQDPPMQGLSPSRSQM